MAWTGALQFAAWNGVPFYVDTVETHAGRNTAVHAYPFREINPVWVEDLGRAAPAHRITGFLIGDTIAIQQLTLLAAVQQPGQGTLVHPTLGLLTGSILGGCSFSLKKDRGRYIELGFQFVENLPGSPYPATTPDTKSDVSDAATNAKSAAADNYQPNGGTAPVVPVTQSAL